MPPEDARTAFESLVAETHVRHALIQAGGQHNTIPTSLATALLLNGTASELRAIYESKKRQLQGWYVSPGRISHLEDRARHLGNVQFQRAYMDFFSMENGRLAGDSTRLCVLHFTSGLKPLIYGLFGGCGRSLCFLGYAFEVQNALMVVQSLVLAAMDWPAFVEELLEHPQLATASAELLSPDAMLTRIYYDGRFSSVIKRPGLESAVPRLLSSAQFRSAVLDYIHRLDLRDMQNLAAQLSQLSTLLLCATHKKEKPAFDYYLGHLPTVVNCFRVLLATFGAVEKITVQLARGVWLLVVLSYIAQLRPHIDRTLVEDLEVPDGDAAWEGILSGLTQVVHSESGTQLIDSDLQSALRSLHCFALATSDQEQRKLYLKAAWKLRSQWKCWIGFGAPEEETLNIRL
ncbi:hypothetical protein VTK73DRAFT_4606 [Phialemonium thermophilum]|uniref:Uncharacterized protein n=1 Tax=Phialemonium thermophilum TaxID=223376 RepID=A0ABR3XZJ8_9PEZI